MNVKGEQGRPPLMGGGGLISTRLAGDSRVSALRFPTTEQERTFFDNIEIAL
jgi:hypothetical protein